MYSDRENNKSADFIQNIVYLKKKRFRVKFLLSN